MGETMRKEKKGKRKKGKEAKSTGWNKFFVVLTMIFTLNYLVWRIFFTMPAAAWQMVGCHVGDSACGRMCWSA